MGGFQIKKDSLSKKGNDQMSQTHFKQSNVYKESIDEYELDSRGFPISLDAFKINDYY